MGEEREGEQRKGRGLDMEATSKDSQATLAAVDVADAVRKMTWRCATGPAE